MAVAGITADMTGIGLYMVDVSDAAARKLYEAAYGCLAAEFDTVAGGVTLTCRDKKPATNFQAQLRG